MAARTAQQILEAMLGSKDSQIAIMLSRIEELEAKLKELEDKEKV